MFSFFKSKKLESVLEETKTIRVHGIRIVICKINVLNYLDGSKALNQSYDLYKSGQRNTPIDFYDKKILEHIKHVIYSGVVNPKITLSSDKDGLFIDKLFTDIDLVLSIYNEIMLFTNGKKKTK